MSEQATFDAVAKPAGLYQIVDFIATGVVHSVKREPVNRGMLGRTKATFELGDFVVGPAVVAHIVSESDEFRCGDAAVCTIVRSLQPPIF